VIVGTKSKKNYVSQTVSEHSSTLRLTLAASGRKQHSRRRYRPRMMEFLVVGYFGFSTGR
jgi:hypothetical protein